MTWSLLFFTTNIFLGIGLAMDAFSVSMANGLNEPHMNKGRICTIAGVFGLRSPFMYLKSLFHGLH